MTKQKFPAAFYKFKSAVAVEEFMERLDEAGAVFECQINQPNYCGEVGAGFKYKDKASAAIGKMIVARMRRDGQM